MPVVYAPCVHSMYRVIALGLDVWMWDARALVSALGVFVVSRLSSLAGGACAYPSSVDVSSTGDVVVACPTMDLFTNVSHPDRCMQKSKLPHQNTQTYVHRLL